MAHDFTGSTNYAQKTPLVTGLPVSMFCHFNSDSMAATKPMVGFWTGAGSFDFFYMYTKSDTKFEVTIRGSTAPDTQAATSSNTLSTGTWYRALAVVTSTAQTVYVDGTKTAGGGTVTVPPAALDTLTIGRDNFSRYFDGRIAEVAIWSVALSDADYAILNAGFSPLMVRPDALVHYAPLIRGFKDNFTATSFAETGTSTVVSHPRVIYPSRRKVLSPAAAAPASVYSLHHIYRHVAGIGA